MSPSQTKMWFPGKRWIVFSACCLLSFPGSASAQGFVDKPKLKQAPSNEFTRVTKKVFFQFGCFCNDALRGSIPIPCTFEYKVSRLAPGAGCNPDNPNGEGQCDTGGHSHNGTRPLVLTPPGQVEFAADEDPDPLIVKGNTLSTPPFSSATGSHSVPQAGGVIEIEGSLTLPVIGARRWFCVDPDCFDLNGSRFKGTVDVRVLGLTQLPNHGPDDFYRKIRTEPDTNHLSSVAFAGTTLALQTLPLIAGNYFVLSGRLLSVNDMSLPKGGVFDLGNDWKSEHKEHREGNDADINQFDPVTGVRLGCEPDKALRLAVDQFLVGMKRKDGDLTALFCEPGGRRHIDFTSPL